MANTTIMGEDKSKILARINALIARSQSSFEEEARTSASIAVKMMLQYGLLPGEPSATPDNKITDEQFSAAVRSYLAAIGEDGGRARARSQSPAQLSAIGRIGARARQKKTTQEQRSASAQKAARARWAKTNSSPI